MDSIKDQVQKQFLQSGRGYRKSHIHAKGEDLIWLTEEISNRLEDPILALDIATGTGHTAFALTQSARRVVGLDLTPHMLEIAEEEADRQNIPPITWVQGDAENLPFPDRFFDIVTCRIAAHHFPEPIQAFSEACRVLIPGGLFILIDNYAPDAPSAEALLNQIEKRRDPSHFHVPSQKSWCQMLYSSGFSSVHTARTWETPILMPDWFQRAQTPKEDQSWILETLRQAPQHDRDELGFQDTDTPRLMWKKAMWIGQR
ncbi:class I SAM-dependent methyltransferase [Kroppenstedtia pulmonis]|uniref:Class I SAM-dependent methyltransferase n=1 Tax=Kroppenstedtia pulmonis TaxID=1380685 RepID=A0A7D4BWT0_9BACL|nr:class I SAM-dependent methyltransferase [Kroppenstedtia pulmonis]QKG85093.1 class I SAM-dependent methyltransferase [Kroppenstedtia pulmonis]